MLFCLFTPIALVSDLLLHQVWTELLSGRHEYSRPSLMEIQALVDDYAVLSVDARPLWLTNQTAVKEEKNLVCFPWTFDRTLSQ